MKKLLSILLVTSMMLMSMISVQAAGEQRPFPQHTAYYSGVIKPNNVTQEDMDNAVKSFYDAWKARYLVTVSGSNPTQKYVYYNKEGYSSPSNAVSCSEGHGYGMLITVLMAGYDANAKADFDALYRFYKAHPSVNNSKLMAWQQVNSGGKIIDNPDGGSDSATDGDLDIAYALLLADKQWGSSGAINYKSEGLACAQATMGSVVNQSEWILKLGDWASNSDSKYGKATRPSDFMLSHLKTFAQIDTANTAKWNNLFNKTCSIINYQYNSGGSAGTGLMPDFMSKNSSGNYVPVASGFLEGAHDGDYDYNSCRTPWRLPIDYILTGDTTIKAQLTTLNTWIKNKTGSNPSNIKNGYYVKGGTNGNAYGTDNELCFTAPFAVSAMIDSSNQAWLNSLWSKIVSTSITSDAYYGNSIKMLCMITVSGNWWTPTSSGSSTPTPTPTATPTPTPTPTATPTPTPTTTPTPGPVWNSTTSYSAGVHNLGGSNTGIRTAEFDMTALAAGIDGLVGYADTSTTVSAATSFAMTIRFNTSGNFDVRNGAAYGAVNTVPYSANSTYHVKMVTDLNAKTYSVWVTPPGGSAIQIANNYAFRSDAPATDDLGQVCVRTAGADNQMKVANHIVY